MKDGVGSALSIVRRTADDAKAESLVKSAGTHVLLVDLDGEMPASVARMVDKRAADTAAMPIGRNEERFDAVFDKVHETHRCVIFVGCDEELRIWQVVFSDDAIEICEIFRRHEIVRYADGVAPDFEQRRNIIRAGSAKCDHEISSKSGKAAI